MQKKGLQLSEILSPIQDNNLVPKSPDKDYTCKQSILLPQIIRERPSYSQKNYQVIANNKE